MRTLNLSLLLLLAGCSLSSNPLESVSPPLEVSPSPPCQDAPAPVELAPADLSVAKLDQAQEFYLWAANAGYPQAQKLYGQWLIEHNNPEEGRQWLEKAAAQGFDPATLLLAQNQSLTDPIAALARLTPLLEKNYTPALLLAADLQLKANAPLSAIVFLEKAADQGDLRAQAALAQQLQAQRSQPWSQVPTTPQNWELSLGPEVAELATLWPQNQPKPNLALQASPSALRDWLSPQEFVEAFNDPSAQGSPFAAFQQLSLRLQFPTLVPKSSISMAQLASIASQIPPGAVLQARLILKGQIAGTYEQAWRNLDFAAAQKDPYALFASSIRSRHINQLQKALDLYQEGLSQPNFEAALLQASNDLIDGIFGFFEDQSAYDSLFLLAQAGYPQALLKVAEYKMNGKIQGTAQEAFLMRYQAAWNGLPSAQYLLANMYLRGEGISQDDQKAFRWFYQSARAGYRPAQYQLSQMFENGTGVLPSLVQAYAWRQISMRGLHEDPLYQVQNIATQLTWDQLDQAVKLAGHYQDLYAHSGMAQDC